MDDCVGVIDECGVYGTSHLRLWVCRHPEDVRLLRKPNGPRRGMAGIASTTTTWTESATTSRRTDAPTLYENYDPDAMADDELLVSMRGAVNVNVFDWNQDGITSIDLLMMLSVYGDTDADFDGVWDSIDLCVDLDACNYGNDPSTECLYLDALGNCGGDYDDDAVLDNLCDDEDLCTDPALATPCPANPACTSTH